MGEVGRFRRNHLVPVPEVASLAELNARIDAWDQQDDQRRIGERPRTVGEYFAIEKPLLQPLPEDHFENGRLLTPRVDRYALVTRGGSRLDLDHYLEGLLRKPGALPGATALDQARAAEKFTPVHDAWWEASSRAHGDAAGTRALIEVLLLHRHMSHDHVVAGIAAALRAGALTSDAVALEARLAVER